MTLVFLTTLTLNPQPSTLNLEDSRSMTLVLLTTRALKELRIWSMLSLTCSAPCE